MKCEAEGKITNELESTVGKTKDGKDWEKREYVLLTNDHYPKNIKFSILSFDGPILNPPKVGDKIKIYFTVEAFEYNGKWFNTVKVYRIES